MRAGLLLRSLCDFRQTCSGLPYSLWALAGCSGRPGYLVWLVRHWVPQKTRWLSLNLSWYAIPVRCSPPPSWAASHQTMRSRLHCLAHAPLVAPMAWPITGWSVPTSHVMQGSLAAHRLDWLGHAHAVESSSRATEQHIWRRACASTAASCVANGATTSPTWALTTAMQLPRASPGLHRLHTTVPASFE